MNDTEILQTLIAARARIADPEHWCKGISVMGAMWGETKEKVCSLGAIDVTLGRFYSNLHHSHNIRNFSHEVVQALVENMTDEERKKGDTYFYQDRHNNCRAILAGFNDRSTHAQVIALWDRTINRLRTLEQLKLFTLMPTSTLNDTEIPLTETAN